MRLNSLIQKYFVLITVCLLLLSEKANASHLMGGDITWTCQGNGQFVFTLRLYRDCNGVSVGNTQTLYVDNHPIIGQIPLNLVSQTDISPVCNAAGPAITCTGAQQNPPMPGAVEEFVFRSAPITLGGTPPAQGWIFSYVTCCRNPALTNVSNGGGQGMTLRAIMYPYNGQNMNPCYDNSPEFLERPAAIICAGSPYSYAPNAVDPELDSLAYSWAEPLNDTIAGNALWNPPVSPEFLPFNPGFSATSPLPGTSLNPNNVPATIDPLTGQIDFTSYTTGNFVTCVKVEAWKCGQLVAEIYREMQVVILACGTNSPPTVAPPLNGGTTFSDTVYAGALVNFTLCGQDLDLLPNGNPQSVSITATGNQFGTGYVNAAAGCLNPPCATLAPPPPTSSPVNACTQFNWQTSCNHINTQSGCYVGSNVYNFVFKVQDDFCPAPAVKFATISITVLATPAVPSPHVHCLAVAPNGDVTITWDQPLDTAGTFNSYHIFTSTNPNGPFTVLDSIFNYNQLSYTHVGANANAGPVYYTVQSRAGCLGMQFSPALDTMSTIYLQVVNNNNGTATLNWNNISVPAPGSQFGQFLIYREHPTGVWTLIDSTNQLTYLDSLSFCGVQVNYRIEIYDTLGCWSVSNIEGDFFTDATIPPIPAIDSVSLDGSGNAILGWQASTTPDVGGYVVYQFINGIWTAVDTVYGINSTSYINIISNADQQSEQYVIAAFDTCGNISAFSPIHQTMFVTSYINVCNATCYLTWNSYINIAPSLAGYDVYVSVNGGPFTFLATNAAGDTTFAHTGLIQNTTYCYYIVANNVPGDISSTSNTVCVFSSVPQQPAYQYLRVVTVSNPNEVTLLAYVDNTADVQGYNVMRADTNIGPFDLIGFIPYANQALVSYVDNTAHTEQQSYYYQLVAVDSCGHPSISSNVSRTIFCTATPNTNFTNTIVWNDYETWLGGITQYNIYRFIDGVYDPTPIATVPYTGAGYNMYVDDVSAYSPSSIGLFSYVIEAEEGPGNMYTYQDSSYSNVAEAPQLPLVYVPNAFTPNNNGNNDIFIPSTGFIDVEDYDFRVYNRWGEQIFQTDDRNVGWDGKIGTNKCESEVYVWSLTFKTATGQYIDMVGTVALIR